MPITDVDSHDQADATSLNWGSDAPRGGKAVMSRILKENATVPLFFGQTLIQSLRDVGYEHTTSALSEHVDNAIQAGATEIRVYFRQTGKRGDYQIDAAVCDNGLGMAPAVLKVATSFGGSTTFDNRNGIGRFGMGMKTAGLSMSPVMELYSWQERGAIYSLTLDVEGIGKDRRNLIELPELTLLTELPDEVADLFKKPMVYPADRNEQELLAADSEDVTERLGRSGTIGTPSDHREPREPFWLHLSPVPCHQPPANLTETAFGRKTRNSRALNENSLCDRNYYHTLVAALARRSASREGGSLPPMLESCALPDACTQVCDEAPGAYAMAKQLFGTDGIRGIPGEYPLDDATLVRVGLALGDFLRAQAKTKQDHRGHREELEGTEKQQARQGRARVLIGRDTRESGPHIAERIARGLETAGAAPVSAGVLTTPGVAWLVHTEGFAAGVVISASHNPYHDNGVKLISSAGMKFPDSVEAGLEKFILSSDGSTPVATAMRLEGDEKLHEDYLDGLRQAVLPGAKFAGMKIVLDCANGAASKLAPRLFRSLGADVVAMNDAPDGRNINANCGSLHPEAMQKRVIELGAALGIAFDGDADRAIFSSASGRLIDGDGVLLVAGRYLKSKGRLKGNTIVGTTMANLGLERALEKDGLKLARTAVGDRYVLEEMQRIGANLGGEQSGHILFLDEATTGDGMLTAVKIASMVSTEGPLDSLVADLKIFPQKIVNVRVQSKPALESLPEVSRLLAEAGKVLGNSGRVVLRYSGTEPLARVMVEAEREEDVRHWTETLASAIRSSIGDQQ